MKTAHANSIAPAAPRQRAFTWNISTREIPFMPMSGTEAAMEGSSSCDCGAITRTERVRPKPPGRTSEQ